MDKTLLDFDTDQLRQACKVAYRILECWDCTLKEQNIILGGTIESDSPIAYEANLDHNEHIIRISCILTIHAGLRSLFDNSENVYGFMSLKNNNPPFLGKSPLEVITTGGVLELQSVALHIQQLGLNQ